MHFYYLYKVCTGLPIMNLFIVFLSILSALLVFLANKFFECHLDELCINFYPWSSNMHFIDFTPIVGNGGP